MPETLLQIGIKIGEPTSCTSAIRLLTNMPVGFACVSYIPSNSNGDFGGGLGGPEEISSAVCCVLVRSGCGYGAGVKSSTQVLAVPAVGS